MSLGSALYVGSVMHRRLRPRVHRFRYNAFWIVADLDELPALAVRLRLFSHNRFNLFGLSDADHGDGSATSLRGQIERRLADAGIDIAGGNIRLLCMPRTLGYSFNPLSVYFCHRPDGTLAALVHEVHNTFGERHCYVMPVAPDPGPIRQHCGKSFYVSPFMGMDMHYEFRVSAPGERVAIVIRGSSHGETVITASLAGTRRALSDRELLRLFVTIPAMTVKVIAAIHWEALRLWLKGLRLSPRPAVPSADSGH